jgi:hypothetical protein
VCVCVCVRACLRVSVLLPLPVPVHTCVLCRQVAFIGSFLVMLYAGIGLFGLPLSRINEYRHRPHRIPDDEYARKPG